MKKEKKYEGFTIIEVVLVLAIAGLIFLMVFIAWPALQRSQRDTQRRNDYSMLSTAISNYLTNNGGSFKNLTGELDPMTYINENGTDPNGYYYSLNAVKLSSSSDSAPKPGTLEKDNTKKKNYAGTGDLQVGSEVYVVIGADCSGTNGGAAIPKYNPSNRAFAVYGYIEGGTQTFCTDSQ